MDRTILLGLDGATWALLDPLMEDGQLPFLAKLIGEGARGDLLSTTHPLTACAWTTLATGCDPGTHGVFDFIRPVDGPVGPVLRLNMSHDIQAETLWSLVTREGGRVSTVNYPLTYPPEPVNGDCLPGFVHWRHLRSSVHPPGLYDILRAIPGFDAKCLSFDVNDELESILQLRPEGAADWVERHIAREQLMADIARVLLRDRPSDLFAIVFDGVDKLQHVCWPLLDPRSRPEQPNRCERDVISACARYFAVLDAFVRDLPGLTGPDARIFVASDHGFCGTEEVFHVNAWLAREGFLAWRPDADPGSPGEVKSALVAVDWAFTRAYSPSPSGNAVFLRETDPFRRATLAAEITNRIRALRSPLTGRKLVTRVLGTEAFPGASRELAPDLTLVLHDHGFVSTGPSDEVITCRPAPAGTHDPIGIFAAYGQGIAQDQALGLHRISDVAPTLLHSLGLPVPGSMEGRVLEEVFTREFAAGRPVRHARGRSEAPRRVGPRAEAAEAAMLERLRLLGYCA